MLAMIKKLLPLLALATIVGLIFSYFVKNDVKFKQLEKYVAQDPSIYREVGRVSSTYPVKVRSFGKSTGISEKTWYTVRVYGERGSTTRELWVYKSTKDEVHVSLQEPLNILTDHPIK